MDFRPLVREPLARMDPRIFRDGPMGLREHLLRVPLSQRLSCDSAEDLFIVDFEGFAVKTREDVRAIDAGVRRILEPLGRKVFTIANYDNFSFDPDLVGEYTDMVKRLVDGLYTG